MMMMIMMMNCFCGVVDRRKVFSFIFSRDHCQRSSPPWIFDATWAWFETAQNLSPGLVEWSCAIAITTIPRHIVQHMLKSSVQQCSYDFMLFVLTAKNAISLDLSSCNYFQISQMLVLNRALIFLKSYLDPSHKHEMCFHRISL